MSGLLALLEEDNTRLTIYALQKLHAVVDRFWAEVATALPLIEELSEDDAYEARDLAAFVASKVFFHLEEYDDALRLGLGAGSYFDVSKKTEYVETLVAKAFDEYVRLRERLVLVDNSSATIDPRLETIVEKMFERCFLDGAFNQAVGIALEAHRLDKIEEAINRAPAKGLLIAHIFKISQTLILSRHFRLQVLDVLVRVHSAVVDPEYVSICQCMQFLNRASDVAEILDKLLQGSEEKALLAYQVAFELVESENQHFLLDVNTALFPPVATAVDASAGENAEESKEGGGSVEPTSVLPAASETPVLAGSVPEGAPVEYLARKMQLKQILVDGFSIDLTLDFLYRHNNTDLLILRNIKTAIENRNSVLHGATVVAHGYMNAGTTTDTFLRENLEWLGRASNWAKFTATASIGVVHKGHVKESMNLLQPYLPQGGISTSPYSEGGALYALGLIHASKGGAGNHDTINYLQTALQSAGVNEVLQHGACLGLGLAAVGSAKEELFEDLKQALFSDNAVAGEAAALSIGLLLLGAGAASPLSEGAIKELLSYAHDTQHEKIIRGLALALALIMYGQEENAESLIEQLTRDRDPILRYGAMFTIGLAYAGTANNSGVRRLLHVAVSDVSDDVRRAAVINLGFALFRTAEQVPRLVSLLAESFNPHVRYGSCLAVGIACAGTGSPEAIALLDPMLDDVADYVRQAAMLGLSMVYMQQSEARVPKVKAFRQRLARIIPDKHQSTMTKLGAILATGILDAGGRNVTLNMQSGAGFIKSTAVVGLAVWVQYWYWYPLMHFLSLAFTPTFLIGLNKDLKIPNKFGTSCGARPSTFAYPKKLEEKKEEKKERVVTAVLSTTAKAKAREAKKKAGEDAHHMDVEVPGASAADPKSNVMISNAGESGPQTFEKGVDVAEEGSPGKDVKAEGEAMANGKRGAETEPTTYMLGNPARVTQAQENVISFLLDEDQRYVPVCRSSRPTGIIMLMDRQPGEPEDVADVESPPLEGEEEEAEVPAPFEWTVN